MKLKQGAKYRLLCDYIVLVSTPRNSYHKELEAGTEVDLLDALEDKVHVQITDGWTHYIPCSFFQMGFEEV